MNVCEPILQQGLGGMRLFPHDLHAYSPFTRPNLVEISKIDAAKFPELQFPIHHRDGLGPAHQNRAQVGIRVKRPEGFLVPACCCNDMLGTRVQVLILRPAGGDDLLQYIDKVLHE